MTAKDFLSQAYRVDRMVTAKLGQVQSLHDLATKASSTLTDMPMSASRNVHRAEDIIADMADLKDEINADIAGLVKLKREIVAAIKRVESPDFRTLLELRYLCFKPWGEIAVDMQYSKQRIYQLHAAALDKIVVPEKD